MDIHDTKKTVGCMITIISGSDFVHIFNNHINGFPSKTLEFFHGG